MKRPRRSNPYKYKEVRDMSVEQKFGSRGLQTCLRYARTYLKEENYDKVEEILSTVIDILDKKQDEGKHVIFLDNREIVIEIEDGIIQVYIQLMISYYAIRINLDTQEITVAPSRGWKVIREEIPHP